MPLITACQPKQTGAESVEEYIWNRSHLVFLDQPDECEPTLDIIAAYFQETVDVYLIRIDFLDLDETNLNNINLLFELPEIPIISEIRTGQDYVVYSLKKDMVGVPPSRLRFLVNTSSPDGEIIDSTPILLAKPPSLPGSAPLLLAFTNELSSQTPAQLLRSWDGAHTGPFGRRHGLSHLLDAATANQVPLFLLDLNSAENLSSLAYLDKIAQIKHLVQNGLLVLPNKTLDYTQIKDFYPQPATLFNIPASRLSVLNPSDPSTQSQQTDYPGFMNHTIAQSNKSILLDQNIPQVDWDSSTSNQIMFPTTWKNLLLQAAANPDKDAPVLLGGDLRKSPWADALIAPVLFKYLSTHPWIEVLDEYSLQPYLKTIDGSISHTSSVFADNGLYQKLFQAPDNLLTQNAWKTFTWLQDTTADPNHFVLRQNYYPQVNRLLNASTWVETPTQISSCSDTFCVLASQQIYVEISLLGGGLPLVVYLNGDSPIEWIASTAQVAVGLSDSSDWVENAGELSDPAVIQGAFSDQSPVQYYQSILSQPGNMIIQSVDGSILKKFSLDDNLLTVQITSTEGIQTKIPVFFSSKDPFGDARLKDNSATAISSNQFYFSKDTFPGYLEISIQGAEQSNLTSYKDSYEWMQIPEDPNQEYPAGHYLPFPFVLIEITTLPETNLLTTLRFE